MPVKQKVAVPERIFERDKKPLFARPIRDLREAIGQTQEGAAKAIAVSTYTWVAWEQGRSSPLRVQLEKIAGLATDPVIRANFWLDIYLAGINLPRIEGMGKDVKPGEIERLRYVNDAVMALKSLHAAAAGGNGAAQEMLRSLADRLLEAAGRGETAGAMRPSVDPKSAVKKR